MNDRLHRLRTDIRQVCQLFRMEYVTGSDRWRYRLRLLVRIVRLWCWLNMGLFLGIGAFLLMLLLLQPQEFAALAREVEGVSLFVGSTLLYWFRASLIIAVLYSVLTEGVWYWNEVQVQRERKVLP